MQAKNCSCWKSEKVLKFNLQNIMNYSYKMCKIIAAVFAMSIFFFGCKKSTYNKLTEEELTWMVYSENQKISFTSASGNLRKYVVVGIYRGYDKNGSVYDEHVSAGIGLENDTLESGTGSLSLSKKGSELKVAIGWLHFSATAYITSLSPTLDTIRGVPYNDIYVVDVPITEPGFNVERVKYSRTKGFIQYIENSGEIWTLL